MIIKGRSSLDIFSTVILKLTIIYTIIIPRYAVIESVVLEKKPLQAPSSTEYACKLGFNVNIGTVSASNACCF